METLETLGRRIATTEDLQSIVRTMKTLSAVSIRQYENAVTALRDYSRTIELALQVVLKSHPLPTLEAAPSDGPSLAVVFGSDHTLCGRFNETIGAFALAEMRQATGDPSSDRFLAVGVQAAIRLEAMGRPVDECLYLPGAVSGLTAMADSLLLKIDAWQEDQGIARVLLFHNRRSGALTALPLAVQLLPLDPAWLRRLAARRWASRIIPTHTMDARTLFSSLVREHLFVSVFRAGAESMASEHATRLASMQAAERNIQERLEEMEGTYRRQRQESITTELLDVVAGFETLRRDARSSPP